MRLHQSWVLGQERGATNTTSSTRPRQACNVLHGDHHFPPVGGQINRYIHSCWRWKLRKNGRGGTHWPTNVCFCHEYMTVLHVRLWGRCEERSRLLDPRWNGVGWLILWDGRLDRGWFCRASKKTIGTGWVVAHWRGYGSQDFTSVVGPNSRGGILAQCFLLVVYV